jgi:hypothetical protein
MQTFHIGSILLTNLGHYRNDMPQVHLFTLDNDLFIDTRVPFQARGNGKTPAARAFELGALVDFVQANLTLPDANVLTATVTTGSPNIAIAAGKLVEKIVVIGSSVATFQMGTTPGSSNILDNTSEYNTSGAVFVFNQYFNNAGQLCFSAFSGTLTVKVYTR